MSRLYTDSDFFVAPLEPPPSRHPPLTAVGPIGWARENLFGGWVNAIATIITGILIAGFSWSVLNWSVRDAQWGVVFNNLRLIAVGQYDQTELWRLQLLAGGLILLTGLSLGIWSRVVRGVWVVVLVVLFIVLLIPIIGAYIPEPDAYLLIQPSAATPDFVFIGFADQEVTFAIDPLTDVSDATTTFVGYQDQAFKSREVWSTEARKIRDGEVDPSAYNLVITLAMRDGSNRPLTTESGPVEMTFDAEQPAGEMSYTLPRDGWYVLSVTRNDTANGGAQNNEGFAWLRIEGVEIYSSQEAAAELREEEYGPPPQPERALYADDSAYRYEGARSLGEFLSLQVSPFFEHIRVPVVAAMALFFNGWVIGLLGRRERSVRRTTIIAWALSVPIGLLLLNGISGSRTLPQVIVKDWQGLLLTILLTIIGVTASFPLGVALALGRRSTLPAIKYTCTLLIETIRGVPLITILFMAKWIVPFFWLKLSNPDLLTVNMMVGLTLFSAAYLAENVRGGLQIVPYGQLEAARALGMNAFFSTTLIVLPQALRAVIPAIVGQFISLFKDTSLVALVGLFELAGIVDLIIDGDPTRYRPYQREAFIFIAIIYFVISYAMSDVSRRLELSGSGSVRR